MTNLFNQKDKQLHFLAGMVIFTLFVTVLKPIEAFIVACVFGLGKEVYDSFGFGNTEFLDFIFTVFGAFIAYIFYKLIIFLII